MYGTKDKTRRSVVGRPVCGGGGTTDYVGWSVDRVVDERASSRIIQEVAAQCHADIHGMLRPTVGRLVSRRFGWSTRALPESELPPYLHSCESHHISIIARFMEQKLMHPRRLNKCTPCSCMPLHANLSSHHAGCPLHYVTAGIDQKVASFR